MDFDEIREEQKRQRQKVLDARERLLERGREGVEENGYVKATVVAWTPGDLAPSYFFPDWEDDEERDEVFAALRNLLDDRLDARATLVMTNGTWEVDDEETAAILIIGRTPNWSELYVLPFSNEDGEVVWGEPTTEEDFDGGFVRVPQEA